MATILERLESDIKDAMRARQEDKLTALRMVKAALKNKEIDKREPLDDAEQQAVLTTLLKQRRESVEQFTKGGRPELAMKEQAEIEWIEGYLPKAATADDLRPIILGALDHVAADSGGKRPGPKDIGPAMRVVQQRLLASGIRADGKVVSDMVREELAKGAADS